MKIQDLVGSVSDHLKKPEEIQSAIKVVNELSRKVADKVSSTKGVSVISGAVGKLVQKAMEETSSEKTDVPKFHETGKVMVQNRTVDRVVDGPLKFQEYPLIENVEMTEQESDHDDIHESDESLKVSEIPELVNTGNDTGHDAEVLNSEEEKYREYILRCMKNGRISEEDRNYLNWKCSRLGLSPERANEIEQIYAPQLTDNEKEYLETYREMISDGEISERMRRLLDRERDSLGITEERAKELERI